jgi:diguanylate cyclase (GGDEF)-like protein
MSTPIKQIVGEAHWPAQGPSGSVLPFTGEDPYAKSIVSDTTKLRIANALQASLHVRDVIKGFGREIRRIVRGVAVRYRHATHKLAVDDGARELHRYSYELNLVGRYLGEITFSRNDALAESELEVLEVLLCALIYPLRNALQYERALQIALKDPLTGVSNRASMGQHLSHHISLSQRSHTPLSVLIIDIDRFKAVNDRYGHIVGDVVLTAVAARIVNCIRTSDGVFRYGGEEFVVVLPATGAPGAELLAERVRAGIEGQVIDGVPASLRVTASIGVAHYLAGESQLDFLQRADDVLLAAKRDGRNRVVVASVNPSTAAR